MKRPNFTGHCRQCVIAEARKGLRRIQYANKRGKSRIASNGYVILSPLHVEETDLPIFRAMQKAGSYVLQHRFVMAKHLGRPLTSTELVDHMDGNKQNNDLTNLRIYVRGRNQAGSAPGHGTYYHEWQMAEARNRLIMAEIERLRSLQK